VTVVGRFNGPRSVQDLATDEKVSEDYGRCGDFYLARAKFDERSER